MGTHPIFESDFDCLTETVEMATERRFPIWEVTPFEREHDYALHSSLEYKDKKKDQICMNKTILLAESNPVEDDEDIIDVEAIESSTKPAYNHAKVRLQFEEIEKHAKKIFLGNEADDSVEPTVEDESKLESFVQRVRDKLADDKNQARKEERHKLFETILKMLNDLYLLFLSIKNSTDEALKRRLAIDKNAAKMRRLFCSAGFKNPNLQWLHDQLTQILPWYLLAPYLDTRITQIENS